MTETQSGFAPHDHSQCRADAMARAEAHCAEAGVKFTPVRRRTLEILLESHEAMGAYDVLARLDSDGLGSKPPIVYRALAFLVEHGMAHKIERLNAFIACAHPAQTHQPAFMICRSCGTVAEAPQHSEMGAAAADIGFVVETSVVELEGLCPRCAEA